MWAQGNHFHPPGSLEKDWGLTAAELPTLGRTWKWCHDAKWYCDITAFCAGGSSYICEIAHELALSFGWQVRWKEKHRTVKLWIICSNLLWNPIFVLLSITVCQKCIHNLLCIVFLWNISKLYLREASLTVIARRVSSVSLRSSCSRKLRSNLTLQLILWSSSESPLDLRQWSIKEMKYIFKYTQ